MTHPRNLILAYQRALGDRPHDPDAYYQLCRVACAAGRYDYAEDIFRRWAVAMPGDPTVDYLRAALLGRAGPDRAPAGYLVHEFDQFAESFDAVLRQLGYRGPDLIRAAVAAAVGPPAAALRVLDAGCGTGLCGPVLRPFARTLAGVDLSAEMLRAADARRCYDALRRADLVDHLRAAPGAYDLVAAADSLIYFGDLSVVFDAAAIAVRPGGFLVATLERHPDGPGTAPVRLTRTGRYSHSQGYATEAAEAAGFAVRSARAEVLRAEEGEPVAGLLMVAERGRRGEVAGEQGER